MIQAAARLLSRYSHVNWALADQTMVSGVNFPTGILLARYWASRSSGALRSMDSIPEVEPAMTLILGSIARPIPEWPVKTGAQRVSEKDSKHRLLFELPAHFVYDATS